MIDFLRKILLVLDKRDKKVAFYVLLLTAFVAVVDALGVASIMPFMAVLSNPDVIDSNVVLSYLYEFFHFKSKDDFLFFLGISVLVFLVLSSALRALVVWAQFLFTNTRNYSISTDVVAGYLCQPYEWFLDKNSSELASSIIEEVSRVVNGCIFPAMRLLSNLMVVVLLLGLMTYADPLLALTAMIVLSVSYGSIIKFAGKRLRAQGQRLTKAQNDRLKAVNEAFGAIKDVKIGGYEQFFKEQYRKPAKEHALASVSAKLWSEMPSFAMQGLVYVAMMSTILYLMKTRGSLDNALPVLSLYALAIYKIMPAVQEVYKQMVEIKYNQPALDKTYENIYRMKNQDCSREIINADSLVFEKSLRLSELEFFYSGSSSASVYIKDLCIEKNHIVGIVGGSGAGKTTVVDIILGLLVPKNGEILVDDKRLDEESIKLWQKKIGYVPQSIYLSDASVKENIAFGVPADSIDEEAVIRAAKAANLHDFVEQEMPQGYDTYVGERGVRLSGGQRQRIGIARALYDNPDILILDEATSALDNITEKLIMEFIGGIGGEKTIIMIAHRLSTIKDCDVIFVMDKGKLIARGGYEQLIKTCPEFRRMSNVA